MVIGGLSEGRWYCQTNTLCVIHWWQISGLPKSVGGGFSVLDHNELVTQNTIETPLSHILFYLLSYALEIYLQCLVFVQLCKSGALLLPFATFSYSVFFWTKLWHVIGRTVCYRPINET